MSEFIETPVKKTTKIKIEGENKVSKVKVSNRKSDSPADKLVTAKELNKEKIRLLREARRGINRDIKKHKLLIKQAKTAYKLASL